MLLDFDRKFGILAFLPTLERYSSDGAGTSGSGSAGVSLTDRRRRAMIALGLAMPGGGIETLWPSRF